MAPERAETRAGRIDENGLEHALGHDRIKTRCIAGHDIIDLDTVFVCPLFEQIGLEGVAVHGRQLHLVTELPLAARLQHDRLRSATCPHFEQRTGISIFENCCSNGLRRCVRHEYLSLLEHSPDATIGQHARIGNPVASCWLDATCACRRHIRTDFLEKRNDFLVGRLDGVHTHEERRWVVRCPHQLDGSLRAQILDELLCEPCRECVIERERLEVLRRISEREDVSHIQNAMQHRICKTGSTRRNRAHELDSLVYRCMRRLAQIDDLVRRDAQRIAHIGLDVAGACECTVNHIVKRPLGADNAQGEQRGKRAILRRQLRAVNRRLDNFLCERLAPTHLLCCIEGSKAAWARLAFLVLIAEIGYDDPVALAVVSFRSSKLLGFLHELFFRTRNRTRFLVRIFFARVELTFVGRLLVVDKMIHLLTIERLLALHTTLLPVWNPRPALFASLPAIFNIVISVRTLFAHAFPHVIVLFFIPWMPAANERASMIFFPSGLSISISTGASDAMTNKRLALKTPSPG